MCVHAVVVHVFRLSVEFEVRLCLLVVDASFGPFLSWSLSPLEYDDHVFNGRFLLHAYHCIRPLSAPSAFRGAARGRAAARRGGHTRGVSVGAVGVMGVEGGKRDDADDRPPSSTPGSAATDQHKQNRAQFRRSVGVMQVSYS